MSAPETVRTTVLVADDDALVRGVLRMALTRLGFEVHEAADATQTVEVARECYPALVVLDVNMPGGSIHDTLDALRDINPEIAVLVLSGEAGPPSDITGPLCAFARKPIELDDLVALVHRLLSPQAQRQAGPS
ncbi:response regulator [Microcella sp.]|uniref:response regulator n=1 Tax=Microcella sp. TaxID=1913979 RepID=UPI00299F72F9|nr:response regulator [Microcella sp.]MDX2026269.1 response regulator [Microcella sp.]